MDHEMSEPELQLPAVTVPPFERVISGLFGATDNRADAAAAGGFTIRFRAEGASMHPAIRDGELITVAPIAGTRVVRGDILLCRHSTRLLAHRVVAVNGQGSGLTLRMRGDAKASCDAPVAIGDVVGRVVSVHRNGRAMALCGPAARLRFRARHFAAQVKARLRSSGVVAPIAREVSAGTRGK